MAEKTIALLVAGGISERLNAALPKPYLPLAGISVLRRAVENFLACPAIDGVRVVIRREHHPLYKKAVEGLTLFPCVIGGDNRQESVRRGLESIEHRAPTYVLVHDVARPLASVSLIERVAAALKTHPAVIPTLPVVDSVKTLQNERIEKTVPRDTLVLAQTPQGFHYHSLLQAHRRYSDEALSDDAALMEKAGIPVASLMGERHNLKLTTREDFAMAEAWLSDRYETRTGFGFDVHRLAAFEAKVAAQDRMMMLCGVAVPCDYFLIGHSDADVALHAATDAILGAIGHGDIGVHFPPHDEKWRGAPSSQFLQKACEFLAARGAALVHLDITLICEEPKIAPHRTAMRQTIAAIAGVEASRVSLKATTTEKLGFTGRGEGIAAQAVATVRLPRQYDER